mmetsp:Transcript_81132/g.161366  ORF Transcript_81132/g.161366 Transcript_81132/m.161366 type:complete len:83 (+) Transcript_81132:467-715(+)
MKAAGASQEELDVKAKELLTTHSQLADKEDATLGNCITTTREVAKLWQSLTTLNAEAHGLATERGDIKAALLEIAPETARMG